eukprot:TRINITY_DN5307_c0_g1_i12.p1 TRINITY_DN5307_c0_g1~~TRINITY_DN5307_c0_g1_i12.p1  ORF type:complete len:1467 (+),score=254.63 TRINITY_DN5307_c0_g1_i12:503-4903(+)
MSGGRGYERVPRSGDGDGGINDDNPYIHANILSRLTFNYMTPLIKYGYKQPLEHDDLHQLLDSNKAEIVSERFEKAWKDELKTRGESASILRAFHHSFGREYYSWAIVKFIYDILQFVGAFIVLPLVNFFQDPSSPIYIGLGYSFLILVTGLIQGVALANYFRGVLTSAAQFRTALSATIYKKSLRLSNSARQQSTVGEIVNLMSVDTRRVSDSMPYLHTLWSSPFQIIVCTILLFTLLGWPVFAGIGVMILMLPLNSKVTQIQSRYENDLMTVKDERGKMMAEVLQGMRIIKFFAWERAYTERILGIRNREVFVLRWARLLNAMSEFFWVVTPLLVTVATFSLFGVSGREVSIGGVFAALSLFNVMRFPLSVLSPVITGAVQARVSLKRINAFLLAEELDSRAISSSLSSSSSLTTSSSLSSNNNNNNNTIQQHDTFPDATHSPSQPRLIIAPSLLGPSSPSISGSPSPSPLPSCHEDDVLRIVGGTFSWNSTPPKKENASKDLPPPSSSSSSSSSHTSSSSSSHTSSSSSNDNSNDNNDGVVITLHDINFSAREGELVIVVGPVGSGKSSLLSALLGELKCISSSSSSSSSLLSSSSSSITTNNEFNSSSSSSFIRDGKRLAYVAQTPWIINATLKDNILMGAPYDDEKYNAVVDSCALRPDITILPAGDATEIGEKGINLSGGQKQRVSLARALYYEADVYLLDDPLSAVDIHVGQKLLNSVILGNMSKATRVLVTHQVYPLVHGHKIVVMQEGRFVKSGPYDALAASLLNNSTNLGLNDESSLTEHVDHPESSSHKDHAGLSAPTTASEDILQQQEDDDDDDSEKENAKKQKQKQEQEQQQSQLITTEERATGGVGRAVYKEYLRRGRTLFIVVVVVSGLFICALRIFSSAWLAKWTTEMKLIPAPHPLSYYLVILILVSVGTAILVLGQSFLAALSGLTASSTIHDTTLRRVFGSPQSFFDTTPVGRILNRFTKDQDTLDNTLPSFMFDLLNCLLMVLLSLILVVVASPFFLIVVGPLGFVYWIIQRYYVATSREIQRLDSVSTSPVYSHFTETLNGVSTIRAFNFIDIYTKRLFARLDHNNKAVYCSFLSNRWLSVRLEGGSAFIMFFAAFFGVVARRFSDPTLLGLALSYTLTVAGNLQWMVRMTSEVESRMNAVERMLHYENLPQESDFGNDDVMHPGHVTVMHVPATTWPHAGAIRFNGVYMRYRPGLPPVLRNLNINILPRTKVGICGRTGSGKSSLMLCLFRLVELYEGSIEIDGVNIRTLPHDSLRSRMAIIPQDPVLFSGTVRSNLDPFSEHTDEDIWNVLRRSGMDKAINQQRSTANDISSTTTSTKTDVNKLVTASSGLLSAVSENGENFSVGERQLLCLARALLRKSKIIVLDEATAAVDHETDAFIQRTLRSECADTTVLTIAHRLHTILDYDSIVVMNKGEVAEQGPPQLLAANPTSMFAEMLRQSAT